MTAPPNSAVAATPARAHPAARALGRGRSRRSLQPHQRDLQVANLPQAKILRMDGMLLLGFGPRTPEAADALHVALYGSEG